MMMTANSRTADKFVIRLPDGMRSKVEAVARISHRSMNSEIITRLRDSLISDGLYSDEELLALRQEIIAKEVAEIQWVPSTGQVVIDANDMKGMILGFYIDGDRVMAECRHLTVHGAKAVSVMNRELYPECKVKPLTGK